MTAPPWTEVERRLREAGIEYPWTPRQSFALLLRAEAAEAERDMAREALKAVGCQGWLGGPWMRCNMAPDPDARFHCVVCRALAPAQQAAPTTDKETP